MVSWTERVWDTNGRFLLNGSDDCYIVVFYFYKMSIYSFLRYIYGWHFLILKDNPMLVDCGDTVKEKIPTAPKGAKEDYFRRIYKRLEELKMELKSSESIEISKNDKGIMLKNTHVEEIEAETHSSKAYNYKMIITDNALANLGMPNIKN